MAKAKAKTNNRVDKVLDAPATMRPEIVVFRITGMSALLQNNPASFIGVAADSGLAAKKKEYIDEEEARLRLYLDGDGNHCHPCVAFTRAMVKAVSGKKFGKMFATKAIQGSVFITEPQAVIELNGKPLDKYEVNRQPVIVGKARILRCRPCFPKWEMRVPLEVDTSILTQDDVLDALSLAGRIIGIGDYRPEKGGGFGRFTAEIE